MFWSALSLTLGYNSTLVTIGATLLGIAAGVSGTFLYLRKNSLISDAISHSTLPGLGLAFLILLGLNFDEKSLIGLLIGSAFSSFMGLYFVNWLTTETRLTQDAAIAAVLSVSFAIGVVILTVIQAFPQGKQAGLQTFLLGSTAGMLFKDAFLISVLGLVSVITLLVFIRPIKLVAFDDIFASTTGFSQSKMDYLILIVALLVTVIGMKIVGLILIVSLLIIPAVSAKFWSNNINHIILFAGFFGGLSCYIGSATSAAAPDLPTGPVIVLFSFTLFLFSLLFAPKKGVIFVLFSFWKLQKTIHLTQGLLALGQSQPIYEAKTKRILKKRGLIRPDGVATALGLSTAAKIVLNEKRWYYWNEILNQRTKNSEPVVNSLIDIESHLTRDQIREIDEGLSKIQKGSY